MNFDGLSLTKLYQQRACMLLWKRFTIFPRNLSFQSSCFQWKLVLKINFLWFSGWKWKICRDQSRLTFSSRGFAARFRARGYPARACAPPWAWSQTTERESLEQTRRGSWLRADYRVISNILIAILFFLIKNSRIIFSKKTQWYNYILRSTEGCYPTVLNCVFIYSLATSPSRVRN